MGQGVSVKTVGNRPSCGMWVNEHRLQSPVSNQYEAWLLGFVSGWSVTAFLPSNPLGKIDGVGAIEWINNYCATHPLEQLTDAALLLTKELQQK